ncbi:MAG: DUF2085 domain-containing protein [Candidatus Bathyarchaeota archaeon]|nr:DUF2085 domain-containing protein [Candidatus Bathyarchaeota archaeon]
MKNFNWEILITHNHWVTLPFYGKKVRVCARCLGVTTGFFTFLITTLIADFTFFSLLNPVYQLALSLSLVSPAIFDWITQCWRFRESNNKLRIFTGFLEGGGVVFLYLSSLLFIQKFFILLLAGGVILNLGFLGRKFFNV